jgi:hypothetical protein
MYAKKQRCEKPGMEFDSLRINGVALFERLFRLSSVDFPLKFENLVSNRNRLEAGGIS